MGWEQLKTDDDGDDGCGGGGGGSGDDEEELLLLLHTPQAAGNALLLNVGTLAAEHPLSTRVNFFVGRVVVVAVGDQRALHDVRTVVYNVLVVELVVGGGGGVVGR